ncbi:Chemotaxis protein [Petrocella atlantisensis]|uniref:Chemotaxis protein n=1 Tax=Petrocella atlantisensis TaxID=2173034 RepID=A0A3P7S4Z3_9FIRM|nr:sugar diacid recognition domain-containing protein [Petrocella atlantisensis]VDN47549.1 Chemotaxis protein [Petrocella atlantisensis]
MYEFPTELAENIVLLLNKVTSENVNYMVEGGLIIASIQKNRIGTIHEGAKRIMAGEIEELAITAEDASKLTGVKEGYNGVVIYKGKNIGCIGISGNPARMKTLQKMASLIVQEEYEKFLSNIAKNKITESIANGIEEITKTIKEITDLSMENFHQMQIVEEQSNHVEGNLHDINGLLMKVNQLTYQTKLLGLNASIEAARAGEAGKGFKVVSEEIGKLSDNSNKAFEEIKAMLNDIKQSIEAIASEIRKNTIVAQEQTLALQSINNSIISIQSESSKLIEDIS